jgi:putative ABC transport system permease protein
LAAGATLALGIGANTAVFSVVHGVILRPLPFSQPSTLVALFQNDRKKGVERDDVAPANFADWRARTRAFAALAAAEPFAVTYLGPDGREQIYNWNVTEDFFSILDVKPRIGRLFQSSDFAPSAPRVVILTYGAWQRRFQGDPNVIGRRLSIDRQPTIVIGVLPKNFAYLESSKMELYVPKVLDTAQARVRDIAWYHVVGRMKPGVTLEQARADARRVAAQLAVEYPATNKDVGVTVDRLQDSIVGDSARALLLLLGAVGMVLLIACGNVANLVVARGASRSQEIAVRTALGASRGRLARQLVAENFLIAMAGGIAGVLMA